MTADDILSDITKIQTIAKGTGLHIRKHLNRKHGRGKWRKLKGVALVKDDFGNVRLAEVHWYEANGIGRRDYKRKRWLED